VSVPFRMLTSMAALTCDSCGAPLPAEARFCPNCGAPVAQPVTHERKVVTVLFADIAGSTELAAHLDPERFREVLAAFFRMASDELASMRGRAEKFVGDAVMAVFGVPQAHDDDALRAIRAGVMIRDRTTRLGEELGLPTPLQVRVGINTGSVAIGSGPPDQVLVSGMAVNLAARLQVAAEPGEILVGETTTQLTSLAVEFGEPRAIPAKGFDEEIKAWPVVALSQRSARRTIPLVDRRRELTLLSETFQRVRETSRSHLVTILGETGIGKSRLVDEFVAGLPEDVKVLTGRATEFEEHPTFAPLAEMVRRELGVKRHSPQEEVRSRLKEVVSGCCDATEIEQVVARVGLALGLGEEARDRHRYRDAEIRAGLLTFLTRMAAVGPTVLVFEDGHMARPPLLDLIEQLLRQARRIPVLVLCLARDWLLEQRPGWGGGLPDAMMIRLEPFGWQEAKELATAAGEGLDEASAERVARHAGGNPFFIIETTGMLLEEHEEHRAGIEHAHLLPPTVQAVIASRLDHLHEDARDLVRKASVLSHSSFDVSELSVIAEPKEETLKAIEDAEIFVHDADRPGVWRFRHELLREVAYESLPKRERLRLHVLVADHLEREDPARNPHAIAHHLAAAAEAALDLDPRDRTYAERAVDALSRAGDLTRWRTESRNAIDLYRRALALAGPEEGWGRREAHILTGMGEAYYWLGQFDAARTACNRALEVDGDDPWIRAPACRFLGDIALNVESDPERADGLFEQALEAARKLDNPWTMARTLLVAGWGPYWRDDLDQARAMFEEALDIARANPEGDPWAEARALTSLSSVISQAGDEAECVKLAEEALAIGRDTKDAFVSAVARAYLGNSLRRMWRLDESLEHTEGALRTFDEFGARWEFADALDSRGKLHRLAGRLEPSERDLREALRVCGELGERSLIKWTTGDLITTLVARGKTEEARELFEDPAGPFGQEEKPEESASWLHTAAFLAWAEGDMDTARRRAERSLELQRGSALRNEVAGSVWWSGKVYGDDVVGGPEALEEAGATLEAAQWIQMLKEPELFAARANAPNG
jgi:class 3 adenylate cyclase/tetratricopeptide (TPR) repeat protein